MGGGGYVPGVIYHPTVPNLRYARTDVGGVYRWDNDNGIWIGLNDSFSRADGGYEGSESLAVDPTNSWTVAMTAGRTVTDGNGRFYISWDQGRSWIHTDLPFPVGANNQGRAIGERLAIDPNQPSTMYYASRTAGLWKSTNSGFNWTQVSSLSPYVMSKADISNTNNGNPIGLEFVVFDTDAPKPGYSPSGSQTGTLYVGVAPDYKNLAGLSSYLYKSTDGGATWTAVSIPSQVTDAIGSNVYIPHMARAADGMFYVPFTSSAGPGSSAPSGLCKFDGKNGWTKLVASGEGTYWGGIGGLSVSGSGPQTQIVFGVSGTWGDASYVQVAMRSTDGGQTWAEIGKSGEANGSTTFHDASGTTSASNPGFSGWVDDLQIDPFNPNHVSYVVGGGIWSTTEAISSSTPHWTFDVNGIEEMANMTLLAPPPGAGYVLASGHGDTGLYVHTSLSAAPTRSPNFSTAPGTAPAIPSFGNGTGIDTAWNNPAFIAAVGTFGGASKGAYSTDAGVTWTGFPTTPPVPSGRGDESKVAVTADGSNVVWTIPYQVPYYSSDRGATWHATNLPAPAEAYHIAADRKNPLKVYAYDHGGNWWYPNPPGRFYVSTDGGHTFTASALTWPHNGFGVTDLAVNPFAEGDVWLADADNLWHSTDSGATWVKLTAMATVGSEPAIDRGAMKVALGVPAAGSQYSAAVYLIGTINGIDGVYRSDDEGNTWVRIDDDNHRYGGVGGIAADTSVYGRVYLSGRGIDYNF